MFEEKFLDEIPLAKRDQVIEEAARIANSIFKPTMSELDKAFRANEYLSKSISYDHFNYFQMKCNNGLTIPNCDYTMEGVFLTNRAVCGGIAKAYWYLLSLGNMESYYVVGNVNQSLGGGGHAWNIVKIMGAYYHVDVTWNLRKGRVHDEKYFCLSDEDMKKTRSWDYDNYPKCSGGFYGNGRYKKVIKRKK